MTAWRNRATFRAEEKKHLQKVQDHVRAQIFDVYKRVLETAPFITSVELGKDEHQPFLLIRRDCELFELRAFVSPHAAQVTVMHKTKDVKHIPLSMFFKPYFSVRFELKHMGKVRRSALILRKKLEMFDIHQVLTSYD